jgi:hypothetical protein
VADQLDLVRRNLRPRCLTNGYGPTETVVTPLLEGRCRRRCEAAYARSAAGSASARCMCSTLTSTAADRCGR